MDLENWDVIVLDDVDEWFNDVESKEAAKQHDEDMKSFNGNLGIITGKPSFDFFTSKISFLQIHESATRKKYQGT